MNFSHFIVTQFNLRNFPLSHNTEYTRWVEWTRSRVDIFRSFCLPSLLNQSCKSFTWLLFFDEATPEEFNGFLNEMRSHDFISICYSKGVEGFESNYCDEISKRIDKNKDWVITSRLDNDDCLHKDAIKIIRENFVEKHKYLISLASGYILNIGELTLSHYFYPMSPFISLIESVNAGISGVFERGHTKWDALRLLISKEIWYEYFSREKRKSRFILKKPYWIQVIHGKNISNSFYRGFPVTRVKDLADYSIKMKTRPQSVLSVRKYVHYVTWKRYFKSLIIKALINR